MPKSVAEHHRNIRALRCVVSDTPFVTLHHCHGGSVAERLGSLGLDPHTTGRGSSEALVLPIAAKYHVGDAGIDYGVGVLTWEERYGSQAGHLDDVGALLGYDLWSLHRLWTAKQRSKKISLIT